MDLKDDWFHPQATSNIAGFVPYWSYDHVFFSFLNFLFYNPAKLFTVMLLLLLLFLLSVFGVTFQCTVWLKSSQVRLVNCNAVGLSRQHSSITTRKDPDQTSQWSCQTTCGQHEPRLKFLKRKVAFREIYFVLPFFDWLLHLLPVVE